MVIRSFVLILFFVASPVSAAEYIVDKKGMHAFIQFKISHLGYSWLTGRFNDFDGRFTYDEFQPDKSTVEITIDPASVDSNHAERDKHLRDEDFLHVSKYPKARFVSTSFVLNEKGEGVMTGKLTLRGVTREIEIEVKRVGQGNDPWGGYRVGFEGRTELTLKDYGITKNLGPASRKVELYFGIEGIRQ